MCALNLFSINLIPIIYMPLTIIQLQARARTFYASTPDDSRLAPSVLASIHEAMPMPPRLGHATRIPRPMSPLGATLFSMFSDSMPCVRGSDAFGAYANIGMMPRIGVNLNAKA